MTAEREKKNKASNIIAYVLYFRRAVCVIIMNVKLTVLQVLLIINIVTQRADIGSLANKKNSMKNHNEEGNGGNEEK